MKTYFNLSVGQFFYRTGSTIHNIKVSSRLYSTNPTVARNLIEKLKEYQAHLRQKSLLEQYDLSRSYEFEKTKLDTTARILFFQDPCTAIVIKQKEILQVSYNAPKG